MRLSYIVIGVLVLLTVMFFAALLGSRPKALGVRGERLLPCPDSPNCVSSFEQGERGMASLTYAGTSGEAIDTVVRILTALPRTTLLSRQDNYARFAVRSARLGFVDDVEFLAIGNTLHFRSASRLGRSDLGVNRTRMTQLSETLRGRL